MFYVFYYVHFCYFVAEGAIIHKILINFLLLLCIIILFPCLLLFLFSAFFSRVGILFQFCFLYLPPDLLHHHFIYLFLLKTLLTFGVVIGAEPYFFDRFLTGAAFDAVCFDDTVGLAAFAWFVLTWGSTGRYTNAFVYHLLIQSDSFKIISICILFFKKKLATFRVNRHLMMRIRNPRWLFHAKCAIVFVMDATALGATHLLEAVAIWWQWHLIIEWN